VEVEVVLAVAKEAEVEVDTPEHEVEVETPELEASGRTGAAAPGGGGTADVTVGHEFLGLVNGEMGKNKRVNEYSHESENENK
jgi:phage gp45-like